MDYLLGLHCCQRSYVVEHCNILRSSIWCAHRLGPKSDSGRVVHFHPHQSRNSNTRFLRHQSISHKWQTFEPPAASAPGGVQSELAAIYYNYKYIFCDIFTRYIVNLLQPWSVTNVATVLRIVHTIFATNVR